MRYGFRERRGVNHLASYIGPNPLVGTCADVSRANRALEVDVVTNLSPCPVPSGPVVSLTALFIGASGETRR